MKKELKFSWGKRIFLLYTAFIAMIIFFVVSAMRQKVDLVADDYYKRELAFQDQIDMTNRAKALDQPLSWNVQPEGVRFEFPPAGENLSGTIFFFRPSDREMDINFPINIDQEGVQMVEGRTLNAGLYRVQVTWQVDTLSYYKEGVIVIQ